MKKTIWAMLVGILGASAVQADGVALDAADAHEETVAGHRGSLGNCGIGDGILESLRSAAPSERRRGRFGR